MSISPWHLIKARHFVCLGDLIDRTLCDIHCHILFDKGSKIWVRLWKERLTSEKWTLEGVITPGLSLFFHWNALQEIFFGSRRFFVYWKNNIWRVKFLFEQLYLFYYFTFLQIICKMGICTHIIIRFSKLLYRLLANFNVYCVLYRI